MRHPHARFMAFRAEDRRKVVRDSVRRELFADSRFSSVRGRQVRVVQAVLQDRVHRIKAVPASSAVVRIPQVRRGPAVIRRVRAWAE